MSARTARARPACLKSSVAAIPLRRARLGLARTDQSPVVPPTLTIAETFRAARYACSPYKARMEAEWACLLMRRSSVLLLDEAGSGLINSEIDELDLIIRRLVDGYHIAALLIEQRLELLSAIADWAVVLDMGEVIANGTPQTVFQNPRMARSGVDVLKITGLTAGYGRLRVLHEIDFKVAEGERLGLVGLNSHGKTTLFRAISSRLG